jgi:cytochrome c-type biogenesis protein CcmH/NrfG
MRAFCFSPDRIFSPLRGFVLLLLLGAAGIFFLKAQEDAEEGDPFTRAYRQALIAFNQADFEAAVKHARAAGALKPTDPKPVLLQGRILMEKNDLAAAIKQIEAAVAVDAQYASSHRYLAEALFRQKDFSKAVMSLQEFLRLSPKDPDGILLLVYCQTGQKDLAAAGNAAAKLDPFDANHPGFYFAKAAMARSLGKSAEAEKHLQNARVLYGNTTYAEYARDYLRLAAEKN